MQTKPRIPLVPPKIAPLPDQAKRPVWSVMIPTYNCSRFLKETIESVLDQDFGKDLMQIEVIDDCSTDEDVEAIVNQIGAGRISFYRQPENVGSLRNFETCINRAQGHYIHILHGDDCVKPGFYKKIGELLERFPEAGAAFCRYEVIDDKSKYFGEDSLLMNKDGIVDDFLLHQSQKQWVQYASVVVKRKVYEELGSFYAVTYGEDWEMWARIGKNHPVAYSPLLLSQYRMHFSSISSNSYRTGKNIKDVMQVLGLINQYLPADDRKKLLKSAVRNYAHWACRFTGYLWYRTNSSKLVTRQLIGIMKVHRDRYVLTTAGAILWQVTKSLLRYYKVLPQKQPKKSSVL